MKIRRKIIEIDEELCNGCGECVPNCAEGALEIVAGKARLVAEKYCDGLGACLGECPTGALQIVEREADDFDEEAVEELLQEKKKQQTEAMVVPCGCPSAKLQIFEPQTPCQTANIPTTQQPGPGAASALAHWPVKIRLVPPTAPFLKDADLLVAADCSPIALASFHGDLLAGRVIMSGCPKFDDAQSYVQKFAEVFGATNINSILIAIMEVPCCSSMQMIIKEALKQSGKDIPTEVVVIGTRGEMLRRMPLAA